MSQFPVYFALTSGPISDAASEAISVQGKGVGQNRVLVRRPMPRTFEVEPRKTFLKRDV